MAPFDSPEFKNPEVQKPKEELKLPDSINQENTDIVKRLGFNIEKGEKIDQKTLE